MNAQEKHDAKEKFKKDLTDFVVSLKSYMCTENGDWSIKGFIDIYKNIYTISSDTKIISKILEIHIFPQIIQFAENNGYKIMIAEKQNWYPDLTFILKSNENIKFALDIKTTFRRNENTAGFTLGSHGGYFKERNKDKNIQFPYSHYLGHYCLGIIYTRLDVNDNLSEHEIYTVQELNDERKKKIGIRRITSVDNLKSITSVISDFDFFIAEKWKIASDKQGSGNTANIGSVSKIADLKNENGTFSQLSEEWFDEYWINFGHLTTLKDGKVVKITNINDFLIFKGRIDLLELIVKKTVNK